MRSRKFYNKLRRLSGAEGSVLDTGGRAVGRGTFKYEGGLLFIGETQIPIRAIRDICPNFNGEGLIFIDARSGLGKQKHRMAGQQTPRYGEARIKIVEDNYKSPFWGQVADVGKRVLEDLRNYVGIVVEGDFNLNDFRALQEREVVNVRD